MDILSVDHIFDLFILDVLHNEAYHIFTLL